MQPSTAVSVVIPAYNEQDTIQAVIDSVRKSCLFSQIIVVNDGSIDNTSNILAQFSTVEVVNLSQNRGKSFAVAKGLERVKSPITCLLDADYNSYWENDLEALIEPVRTGACEASIRRARTPFFTFLSGCRCYRTSDLKRLLPEMKSATGYGLELLLNVSCRYLRTRYVTFRKSQHVEKYSRYNLGKAAQLYMRILSQVVDQYWQMTVKNFRSRLL